ncbi:MAG: apolipoprotein N-acyltransferase [Deltaproteobacteria bacterium RBG_16_49_23]|nr:MAG: apolipoprotein N-acyltransferase [Deltaproteobacteria bacterium RBG_16_49_23]
METMKKKDLLFSLLSGILLILSFPNFDLEFLAWVALVPLFYAVEGQELWNSFKLGFLTGLVSFLGILYWIIVAVHTYGNISLIPSGLILLLLIGYLSLFIGAFTLLYRFIQIRLGLQTILLAPLLWASLEYLRSFLLTGFPWANLGYSQYLNLPFIQMADITGVYGLSFVILLMNASLHMVLLQWSKRTFPLREVAITILLLLGFLVYGYLRIGAVDRQMSQNSPLKISLVQGNIDQAIKWDESFQKETMKIYEKLSLKVAEGKPDLIIWPETATPFFFQEAKEHQPLVLGIPKQTGAFLLFGTPSYKIERGKVHHYNSALMLSPAGELVGKYDKIHLVPYGEYVPLGEYLSLGSLGEGIGNFKSGKETFNFTLPQGKFGVLICFEIIFPDLCRRFVKNGANFLVTITNDAWFGRTSAPYQHLTIATFRAIENRVFIARSANTGISAFIDPVGRIMNQGGIFTEEAMSGTIRLPNKKTFYTLYGDVFAWICSAFSMALLGYALIQNRRKR